MNNRMSLLNLSGGFSTWQIAWLRAAYLFRGFNLRSANLSHVDYMLTCTSIDSKRGTRGTRRKPLIQGLNQLKLIPRTMIVERTFEGAIDDHCVSHCILEECSTGYSQIVSHSSYKPRPTGINFGKHGKPRCFRLDEPYEGRLVWVLCIILFSRKFVLTTDLQSFFPWKRERAW